MTRVCLLLLIVCYFKFVTNERVVVCYYGSWAAYRPGLGKFDVSNIHETLCTHIIYSFLGIDWQGNVISLDPYLDYAVDYGLDNLGKFAKLKAKNPNLKLILAIGGWNEGSAKFSNMAASTTYRKNFITTAIKMLQTYKLDGIDIDWEYPNQRDSVYGLADVSNFVQLLKELRMEFDKYGLVLTVAVSAGKEHVSCSYDVPGIAKYVDLINIMTYDMNGPWDGVTGHNAPLHKGEGDTGSREDVQSIDVSVENWICQGAPPNKIALGVPFYGHSYTLKYSQSYSVRSPTIGPGISGIYTTTSGDLGYNEFCDKLQTEKWSQCYDSLAKVPYAHLDKNWVSYDNRESLTCKVDYALCQNLAGIMIWSIDTDDFNNVCGAGDFPLLRALNIALGRGVDGNSSSIIDTTTSNTTTK